MFEKFDYDESTIVSSGARELEVSAKSSMGVDLLESHLLAICYTATLSCYHSLRLAKCDSVESFLWRGCGVIY